MTLEASTLEERDRQKRISELEARVLTRKEGTLMHRFLTPRWFVHHVEDIADIVGKEMRCVQNISTTYSFSHGGDTQSEIAGRFRAYEYVDGEKMDQRYSATATIAAKGVQVTVKTIPRYMHMRGHASFKDALKMGTMMVETGIALGLMIMMTPLQGGQGEYGGAAGSFTAGTLLCLDAARRYDNLGKTHGIEVRFKTTEPVSDEWGYIPLGKAYNEVKRFLER